MKKEAKRILAIIMFTVMPAVCLAFDEPPEGGSDPDTPAPVDGGISLLIAAGIGIGAKKAYQAKQKK